MSASIIRGSFFEDDAPTIIARVLGNTGVPVLTTTVSAITCSVFDLDSSTPETSISSPTVTVSTSVYDTLQTSDSRWTLDGIGYNFLHSPAASIFTNGDRRYRIEYVFDPTSGDNFRVVVELAALKIYGS